MLALTARNSRWFFMDSQRTWMREREMHWFSTACSFLCSAAHRNAIARYMHTLEGEIRDLKVTIKRSTGKVLSNLQMYGITFWCVQHRKSFSLSCQKLSQFIIKILGLNLACITISFAFELNMDKWHKLPQDRTISWEYNITKSWLWRHHYNVINIEIESSKTN